MSRTGVARPACPANLRELQRQFATAEACQQYLTASRGPTDSTVPDSGYRRAYPMLTHRRGRCVRVPVPGLPAGPDGTAQHMQPLRSALWNDTPSLVPLADRAIGNLQPWLNGTSHGVSQAPLPVDLDECVVRHNRRWTPHAACQTLLGLGTGRAPTPSRRIRHPRDVMAHGGSPQHVGTG